MYVNSLSAAVHLAQTKFGRLLTHLEPHTDTHRELRLTVQELQQVGDLSPAASVRLGVGLYLLGRSSEAVVSLKSGDGSALALFALGLAQAALAATDDACASFDAARTAGYPAGACLAAKANTLRAANRLEEAVANALSNATDEEKSSAEYLAAQGAIAVERGDSERQRHSNFFRRLSMSDSGQPLALFCLGVLHDRTR